MADPEPQIRGGGGGGVGLGGLSFGPQIGLKISWGLGPLPWIRHCFPWRLSCSTDATLSHIANDFQSWSTVAGYEQFIARGFKPIRNREIF